MKNASRDLFVANTALCAYKMITAGYLKAKTRAGVRRIALQALKALDGFGKYEKEWSKMADWITEDVAGSLELKK